MNSFYAVNLLHRFDMTAKILYIKYKNIDWFKELYKNHILTFNGGWEHPGTKVNIAEFLTEFDKLIESFKTGGFNEGYPITVDINNLLIDGMHRLTLSYMYETKLLAEIDKYTPGQPYNFTFFKNRNPGNPLAGRPIILNGMEDKYMDRMALEFMLHSAHYSGTKIITMFPKAVGKKKELESLLTEYGTIYYKKRIKVTKQALINLTHELYRGEEWVGGFFPKDTLKANRCWGEDDVRIYVFAPKIITGTNRHISMREVKEKIRDIYQVGNHSVHIHDDPGEGIRIAKAVLSNNTWHLFHHMKEIPMSNRSMLSTYHTAISDSDKYCIGGSFVLSLYGLRESRDLDYLSLDRDTRDWYGDISCHNGQIQYYPSTKEDIICNPDYHMYFAGMKIITLDTLKHMKASRKEPKDIVDISLISKFSG